MLNRLNLLHEILADMAESPRVVQCAQVVPVLLHVYFNTVIQVRVTNERSSHLTEISVVPMFFDCVL